MRNYGRISTSIWRDEDFLTLHQGSKLAYLLLVSQANISPCGVLELTERRWAKMVGFDLGEALAELDERRFVLIDRDTEELLVRSFVRWDGGFNNDLRRRSILEAAEAVSSPTLRHAIALELSRLGIAQVLSDSPSEGPTEALSDGLSKPHSGPPERPLEVPPDSPSDSRRVVVKREIPEPQPLTTTHNQESPPSSDSSSAAQTARTKPKPRLPVELREPFSAFWAAYPRRVGRAEAERKFCFAAREVDPAVIVAAAASYAQLVANAEPRFVAHPATWLNQGRWNDEPPAPPPVTRAVPWLDANGRQVAPSPWWDN